MNTQSDAGLAMEHAIAAEVRSLAAARRISHKAIQQGAGMHERSFRRYFVEMDRRIPFEAVVAVAAQLGVKPSEIVAAAEAKLGVDPQEAEARELMGEEAWRELQATRESHRSRQSQKRQKA